MKVYEEFLSLSQPHQNKENKLLASAVPAESKPSKPSGKVWRQQGIFEYVLFTVSVFVMIRFLQGKQYEVRVT